MSEVITKVRCNVDRARHVGTPLPLHVVRVNEAGEILWAHAHQATEAMDTDLAIFDSATNRPGVDFEVFGNLGDGEEGRELGGDGGHGAVPN